MARVASLCLLWLCFCAWTPLAASQDPARSANTPNGSRSAARPEWELLLDDDVTAEEYARQIDYFKIEVGAVSKNGKIEYATNVGGPKPDKRVGFTETEYRLRIGWKSGALHAADRKLLAKAGIVSTGKDLWHYFPIDVQKQLQDLEVNYAGRKPEEIRRTRFRIRPKTKGYEFVVLEQDPPKPIEKSPSANESLNQPSKP